MRFEVPQFIDVEDKIFGELSLKQFIYVAGGIGACVVLFFATQSMLLFILIAPLVIALSFGLAFVPVNKRPLSVLLEAMVYYFTRSRLYLWKKRERTPAATPDTTNKTGAEYKPPKGQNTIASLSRDLELKALNENNASPTEREVRHSNHGKE